MRAQRRVALMAALVAMSPGLGLWAQQQLTNFCVVEVGRVQEAFFRDSKRSKEFQAFRDNYRQELKVKDEEIAELQRSKLEASRVNNADEVARLERQIASKQADRDTYRLLQEDKRLRMLDDLMSTDKFYREMIDAIEWVCHQEGYSGAFQMPETQLLWYDPEIDITQKVIDRMGSQ